MLVVPGYACFGYLFLLLVFIYVVFCASSLGVESWFVMGLDVGIYVVIMLS